MGVTDIVPLNTKPAPPPPPEPVSKEPPPPPPPSTTKYSILVTEEGAVQLITSPTVVNISIYVVGSGGIGGPGGAGGVGGIYGTGDWQNGTFTLPTN